MESDCPEESPGKSLCDIKGISKHKLWLEDLQFLFKRSKIVRKILSGLLADHRKNNIRRNSNSSNHDYFSILTCRSMDSSTAVYVPREVEFSCSNTPSFPSLYPSKRKIRRRHLHHHRHYYHPDSYCCNDPFEMLDSEDLQYDCFLASPPSPMTAAEGCDKSPAAVRQLRVTDSPFPAEEEEVGGEVDRKAEEFIRWFHEELRMQRFGACRTGLDR
ncbi:uncharacterized protein [Typha latifolia]|uniref:uncharacterized protein n=1 Tax=Typha latifolia TaxID=4733 RepID=UPI003C2DB44C